MPSIMMLRSSYIWANFGLLNKMVVSIEFSLLRRQCDISLPWRLRRALLRRATPDMHQFLKRNATILTYTFEVNEEDYDESVLPTNVVASACRRINHALQEKKRVPLGKASIADAAKVAQEMIEYLSNDSSNDLESKQLSLSSFPKQWDQKRKRLEESESDEEDGEDRETKADQEYEQKKKKYEKNLRKACKLEEEVKAAKRKLQLHKELSEMTNKINTKDIPRSSVLTADNELAEELKKTDAIAARINKKLAQNPEVLEKLRVQRKRKAEEAKKSVHSEADEESEKTPNQVAHEILLKLKEKKAQKS